MDIDQTPSPRPDPTPDENSESKSAENKSPESKPLDVKPATTPETSAKTTPETAPEPPPKPKPFYKRILVKGFSPEGQQKNEIYDALHSESMPGGSFMMTTMDQIINLARSNSLWPLTFGTSCCAIEMMMATGASRHDVARFGAEVARPSPRQADLLILAGTIVKRMAPRLRTLYDQMAEPRYVIATGACTISGGPFMYHSYTTVRGADEIIPVDVYVPGCPPRPEALFYGILTLQKMIKNGETMRKPGIRHKPVFSALPPEVSMDQINAEMREILEKDSVIDVEKDHQSKPRPKGLDGKDL